MKRTVEHIYNLSQAEVIEAFRWWFEYRQLRTPEDDKHCTVEMGLENGGATVIFTEEVQDTHAQPGELKWMERTRMSMGPRDYSSPPEKVDPDG
jgi:hypothetical protein